MKKLTALLLAVLLVFGLAACAGSPAESNAKPGDAVAHSVVLMRAQDAETAKKLAADVEANLNPAKWVCVEAEKTAVLVHNCTVLLVMSWSNVTDALTANFNALWS